MKNPHSSLALFLFGLKLSVSLAWGMCVMTIAIVLAFTVIGIPVAIILLPIAAWPMKRQIEKRNMKVAAWEARGRALPDEGEVPWEL